MKTKDEARLILYTLLRRSMIRSANRLASAAMVRDGFGPAGRTLADQLAHGALRQADAGDGSVEKRAAAGWGFPGHGICDLASRAGDVIVLNPASSNLVAALSTHCRPESS